jgi:signal transduction histidine kinase
MAADAKQPDLAAAIAQVQRSPQALDWPQRRALVKAVAEQFSHVGPTEAAMSLLLLLANDPKWEVRKDVADCLSLVPDDEFPRLAAKLARDTNSFVQNATERAMDRRRRGQRTAQKKRRGLDQVEDQYANIEKMHGSIAAEKARQMAERLYDVLVGATVHDMRNILSPLKSSISAMLGHLNDNRLDAKLFEKNLTKMGHQAEMLERLLEDMRAYSQPTPTGRRRERLVDVVKEAHGMVMDAFRATGRDPAQVTARIDVPEKLTVEMSRHQIVRAIGNVLKNAYESFATDPQTFNSGEICLTAKSLDGDRVEVVVSDNGMGLSADELDDVRRFVPGGTSKKTHGTGFGLPIAKRKIEDHGGSLAIDSEEDKGTTVIITLPVEAGGSGE